MVDIGIPEKISELQVTEEHFEEMAVDAVNSPPSLSNPRRCTKEELVALYWEAL